MKLLILGDLHYPTESRYNQFKKVLTTEKPDVVLLCGDILNYFNLINLDLFLQDFHESSTSKLIAVMGNHDFWLTSIDRTISTTSWSTIYNYRRLLREYGDVLLWTDPYIIGDVGFAGVPGWFDFSFAPWKLGYTIKDFEKGVNQNSVWGDIIHTHFLMDYKSITKLHVALLEKQLKKLAQTDLHHIIVLFHFVPLAEFISNNKPKNELFWNAYYGSNLLGEAVLKFKRRISYVFFGHVSQKYLTHKKIVKEGIPFESVDISESINHSKILLL